MKNRISMTVSAETKKRWQDEIKRSGLTADAFLNQLLTRSVAMVRHRSDGVYFEVDVFDTEENARQWIKSTAY